MASVTPTPTPGSQIELANKGLEEVGLQKLSYVISVPTRQENEGDRCVNVASLGFPVEARAAADKDPVKDASERGILPQHATSSTVRKANPRMLLNSRGELGKANSRISAIVTTS